MSNHCDDFLAWLEERNKNQPEFTRAVKDLTASVRPLFSTDSELAAHAILYRLAEPDRIVSFRVTWSDDKGRVHINRGWRVQHCGAVGPYKGGLRFHPELNESVLKFLAFEQTLKNALTGLPIGGGKGGADFDPQGRSNTEIMRFCQAFMTELYRHIGERTDVPAGDINVGQREIGYLFGQYRRLSNVFTGSLTGKNVEFGGSEVRVEATGFGVIYFLREMLKHRDQDLDGKTIAVSGAGNVALHAALKAASLGAKVITLSSREGTVVNDKGFSEKRLKSLIASEKNSTEKLKQLCEENGKWLADKKPWEVECDIALPCATQNELDEDDAKALINNDVSYVVEGANMPCTAAATAAFAQAGVTHAPGKASNAGGVALSGLEMMQNATFTPWDYEQLDKRLQNIMQQIHQLCLDNAGESEQVNYHNAANIAGFKRVAAAMISQGFV